MTSERGGDALHRAGQLYAAYAPEALDSFIAGSGYGLTSVIVGQPFDTIKTRAQMGANLSSLSIATKIYAQEGIRGLYRGGLPLVVGGALIRSAQFGVNSWALDLLRQQSGGAVKPSERILGVFDWQIVAAGFCGGFARGIVEVPFEYIKVRRQVVKEWKMTELFSGSSATIVRNSFLFSSFVIYMDISKQIIPGGLSPFLLGAICSNMAWLTVWPLDVAKSQLQSGNYQGKSFFYLLKDIIKTGALFRGIVPGLTRSTIANGFAMMAYKKIEKVLGDARTAEKKH